MMKHLFIIFSFILILVSCNQEQKNAPTNHPPKYVFYFIGDGYGPAQAHLAEAYLGQKKGRITPDTLFMNTFPVHGTYTTYARNRFITGSAAAGTALASGHKTSINTICMDESHSKDYKSIASMFRDKGMKVGIVTSVSIDHATPAVFYAHESHRNNYYEIALDLSKSKFNYFAGGGFKDPMGEKSKSNKTSVDSRKELVSAYSVAEKSDYRFVNKKQEFQNLKKGDDKVIVFSPRPSDGKAMPYVIDQTKEDFTLVDYTSKGIELLDNPNGFFMMVEGGKIDWACHANDVATTVHEVLQFDEAIKEAYNFYKKHPQETLIVICSDHETGGLTLGYALSRYETTYEILENQKISGETFTHIMNDLQKKQGKSLRYKDVYPLLKKYYGFDNSKKLQLTKYDIADLKKAIMDYNNHTIEKQMLDPLLECAYGPYNPVATIAARILAHKAGISWTTYSHTAIPCPARAIGVGAEAFYGYYDNTAIPRKIMKLYGFQPSEK